MTFSYKSLWGKAVTWINPFPSLFLCIFEKISCIAGRVPRIGNEEISMIDIYRFALTIATLRGTFSIPGG